MKELTIIQSQLKAPKDRVNNFGKYCYRSCEDIYKATKPLCAAQGCHVTCNNDLVMLGDMLHIKATATITNSEGETVSCTSFATIDYEHRGMSKEQVTGTAVSYANKYALSGLFAIDDTKDADELPPVQQVVLTDGIKNAVDSCNDTPTLRQLFKSHEEEWKHCRDIINCINERKQQLIAEGK